MLVLSRHVDESVMIGDSIEITVIEIRGDKVRIGVRAPDDVLILRDELRDRLERERLEREREGGPA